MLTRTLHCIWLIDTEGGKRLSPLSSSRDPGGVMRASARQGWRGPVNESRVPLCETLSKHSKSEGSQDFLHSERRPFHPLPLFSTVAARREQNISSHSFCIIWVPSGCSVIRRTSTERIHVKIYMWRILSHKTPLPYNQVPIILGYPCSSDTVMGGLRFNVPHRSM